MCHRPGSTCNAIGAAIKANLSSVPEGCDWTYHWRRWPASGMSGSRVTLVEEVVDSVRPLKSPILAFFSARMGCCPALSACRRGA